MEILDSDFLVEVYTVCYTHAVFLLCRHFPMPYFLVIHVYVCVFDEIFTKFAHALCVFRARAIPDDTGASARFEDLRLREDV